MILFFLPLNKNTNTSWKNQSTLVNTYDFPFWHGTWLILFPTSISKVLFHVDTLNIFRHHSEVLANSLKKKNPCMHCIFQMPLSTSNHWIGNLVPKIESNYLWKVSDWHSLYSDMSLIIDSIIFAIIGNENMLKFSIYQPHIWFYHVIPIYVNKNNSEYSIHQIALNPLNKYYWQMTNHIIPSAWSQMEAEDKECHTNDYW